MICVNLSHDGQRVGVSGLGEGGRVFSDRLICLRSVEPVKLRLEPIVVLVHAEAWCRLLGMSRHVVPSKFCGSYMF